MLRALHGRAAELGAAIAALPEVARGHAQSVALVGEPGIGKSRLASEIARLGSDAGFTCAWGRAWEAGGAPAYWPWRSLLETLVPAPSRKDLTLLWGDAPRPRTLGADPDQARFELFDAVAAALRAAAQARPVLCVFDDLHAADFPSLELLAFATRHLRASPILWVLTWRDVEADRGPAREPIARIARDATVIPLRRLSEEETIALVREWSPSVRAEALYAATAGNPLFLVETLACLAARPFVDLDTLPLAQGVAAIVKERTRALDPAGRRALEAASLLGREVALARWAEAMDVPEAVLRQRAADLDGILVESGLDRWTFTHEIVRIAVRRDVPPELALAGHRRVAEALDRRVRAGQAQLQGERLHHGMLGGVAPPTLVQWAIAASDHARAQCAYEEAAAVLARTRAALPAHAADPGLLLASGRALLDVGDTAAARSLLAEVIRSGDPSARGRAVLAIGSRYVLGDVRSELVRMIDEALAALGSAPELEAELLSRKAAALTPAARPEEALAMARRAWALVAGSEDARARLEVAVSAGSALGDFAPPQERIPVNRALVDLARAQGERALELRGLTRLVTDFLEAGDFAQADALLDEREALARSLRLPRFRWSGPLLRSMRAMVVGRFEECRAAIEEAERVAAGDSDAARCIAVHRTWLLLLLDDVPALRAHQPIVEAALRSVPPALTTVVRATIAFRAGALADARRELEEMDPSLPHLAVQSLATLAEVVAAAGPSAMARVFRDRLLPHADSFAIWGPFGFVHGPHVSAALGLLDAALGEHASAARHFARAAERTAATRPLHAWTRHWMGASGSAAAEAAALGMEALAARARVGSAMPRLRRSSAGWVVERGGSAVPVPDLRGMPMLARLLASPDSEIHSLELASGCADTRGVEGDAGEHLDARARAAYTKRAADLEDLVREALERGDHDAADDARGELAFLGRELARAKGLGERSRHAGSAAERARVSVQRRIREAVRRIGEVDAPFAEHLERTIRTGTFCVYQPNRRPR
jgi:tetratricopeptide (TPR) repeat protein